MATPLIQILTAARISFAAAAASIGLLVILHFVRTDLDPLASVLSEYALGDHSWLLMLWFFSLALASAALCFALVNTINSVAEGIGLGLLLLGAVNLVAGGIFPMDPITANEVSFSGMMHGLTAMIGITSLVVASLILGLKLRNRAPWASVRRPLLFFALLTLFGDIAMTAAVIAVGPEQSGNAGGLNLIGLGNRLIMAAFTAWLMVAAWALTKPNALDVEN